MASNNRKLIIWTEEEIDYLKNNYEKTDTKFLSIKLNKPIEAIWRKAKILQIIKKRSNSNLNLLLAPTPTAHYWMGLLLTDGHFCFKKSEIRLELARCDSDVCKKYSEYINLNKVSNYTRIRKGKTYHSCVVRSKNTKIFPQISSKFDIKNKKTYNPPDPTKYALSDNNFIGLLCGMIDGDGYIAKNGRLEIRMHQSWISFLDYLAENLYKALNIKPFNKKIPKTKLNKRGYACLQIGECAVIKLLKLKAEELNLPLMSRKWLLIKNTFTLKEKFRQSKSIIEKLLLENPKEKISIMMNRTNSSRVTVGRILNKLNKSITFFEE